MAAKYPSCQWYGVDLADTMPTAIRPRNTHFFHGNILEGLLFADGYFDYVHQRAILSGIPRGQWTTVLRELTRLVKPGGCIELVEFSLVPPATVGPHSAHMAGLLTRLFMQRFDVDPMEAVREIVRLEEYGCVDVKVRSIQVPVGVCKSKDEKARKMALEMLEAYEAGYKRLGKMLLRFGMVEVGVWQQVLSGWRLEMLTHGAMAELMVVYGTKPV